MSVLFSFYQHASFCAEAAVAGNNVWAMTLTNCANSGVAFVASNERERVLLTRLAHFVKILCERVNVFSLYKMPCRIEVDCKYFQIFTVAPHPSGHACYNANTDFVDQFDKHATELEQEAATAVAAEAPTSPKTKFDMSDARVCNRCCQSRGCMLGGHYLYRTYIEFAKYVTNRLIFSPAEWTKMSVLKAVPWTGYAELVSFTLGLIDQLSFKDFDAYCNDWENPTQLFESLLARPTPAFDTSQSSTRIIDKAREEMVSLLTNPDPLADESTEPDYFKNECIKCTARCISDDCYTQVMYSSSSVAVVRYLTTTAVKSYTRRLASALFTIENAKLKTKKNQEQEQESTSAVRDPEPSPSLEEAPTQLDHDQMQVDNDKEAEPISSDLSDEDDYSHDRYKKDEQGNPYWSYGFVDGDDSDNEDKTLEGLQRASADSLRRKQERRTRKLAKKNNNNNNRTLSAKRSASTASLPDHSNDDIKRAKLSD